MAMTLRPLVTVYVPCHNYAGFVLEALQSVASQSYRDLEIFVIDDGSTDSSSQVIEAFVQSEPRATFLRNEKAVGLRKIINAVIPEARGEYVLRLDADDLLETDAIETMVSAFAEHDDKHNVVIADHYHIDAVGNRIATESLLVEDTGDGIRRPTSFPPHPAGALVKRDLLLTILPLDERFKRQDGHESWLKFLARGARILHIPRPLFSYRDHGTSLSSDTGGLLSDRAAIKRSIASESSVSLTRHVLVPVCNTYPHMPDIPFAELGGVSLLDRTLRVATGIPAIPREGVAVSTDCPRVAEAVSRDWPGVGIVRRPPELEGPRAPMNAVIAHAIEHAWDEPPSRSLAILSVHTPFVTAAQLQEAIDTFALYECDSVVSVYEERGTMYRLGTYGLDPLNPVRDRATRSEREVIYVDNGAIRIIRPENLGASNYGLGARIGHLQMDRHASQAIKTMADYHRLVALTEVPDA